MCLPGSCSAHLCPWAQVPAHRMPRMTVQQETCQFTANESFIIRISFLFNKGSNTPYLLDAPSIIRNIFLEAWEDSQI